MSVFKKNIIKKYKYFSLDSVLYNLEEDRNKLFEQYNNLKTKIINKESSNQEENYYLTFLEKEINNNRIKIKNTNECIEKIKRIIKEEIYIHHFYHYIYEKEKNIIYDYNIRIAIHQIEKKYKYTKYNDFYILDSVYNTGNNKYIIIIYSKLVFSGFDYFIIKNDDIYRYSNINELELNDPSVALYNKESIEEKILLLSDPIRNIKLKLDYEIIVETEQLDMKTHNIENIIKRIQNGEYIDKK